VVVVRGEPAVVGTVAHFGGSGLGADARQVRDAGGRSAAVRGGSHHVLEALGGGGGDGPLGRDLVELGDQDRLPEAGVSHCGGDRGDDQRAGRDVALADGIAAAQVAVPGSGIADLRIFGGNADGPTAETEDLARFAADGSEPFGTLAPGVVDQLDERGVAGHSKRVRQGRT